MTASTQRDDPSATPAGVASAVTAGATVLDNGLRFSVRQARAAAAAAARHGKGRASPTAGEENAVHHQVKYFDKLTLIFCIIVR